MIAHRPAHVRRYIALAVLLIALVRLIQRGGQMKRKPLPYHCSMAIDKALMENSDVMRLLRTLKKAQGLTNEEMSCVADAIDHLHEANTALKEARQTRPE
ncbi:MAG: hypothetical protein EHM35_02755 [Planctomycetaceae bacterium]|nr:MAG: hypothetical protein EHM35_02755 [Planctomycetaceae bacterium]